MNHKEKLLEIYSQCIEDNLNVSLSSKELNNISTLGSYAETQKGVFTVLLTLGIHKILNPHQDVRFHQTALEGGFSGEEKDKLIKLKNVLRVSLGRRILRSDTAVISSLFCIQSLVDKRQPVLK